MPVPFAGRVKQISTGQRAALMLSVFLTLNLSLKSGPPFMLIDDPIAHNDDLNALSFLDFLADVAESKQRQIFFATANEKLANVFQKKMEFLGGNDFKTLNMPA
jgi:exonuclease SbcC